MTGFLTCEPPSVPGTPASSGASFLLGRLYFVLLHTQGLSATTLRPDCWLSPKISAPGPPDASVSGGFSLPDPAPTGDVASMPTRVLKAGVGCAGGERRFLRGRLWTLRGCASVGKETREADPSRLLQPGSDPGFFSRSAGLDSQLCPPV